MGRPLFNALFGPAGSGKSFWIKSQVAKNPRFAAIACSTGVAAVNLGGEAVTINSLLGYFNTQDLMLKVGDGKVYRILNRLASKYNNLLIDEVGMVSAQQLDLITYAIRLYNEKNPNAHFGLWIVGDLGQLPPVIPKGSKETTLINAKQWDLFDIHELTEVKRQDNLDFVKALMLVRAGRAREAVDYFKEEVGFERTLDMDFKGTTVLTTNNSVDAFNNKQMAKLEVTDFSYPSRLEGIARSEWSNIPERVVLKKGCVCIMLANRLPEYANGDLAIVKEIFTDFVAVEIQRTKKVHTVHYHKIEHISSATGKIVGSISYLPIRVAYASTTFKVQGLTLDRVQVRVSDQFYRSLPGGLYVALSRCRTPEGLRLVGTPEDFVRACCINDEYAPYLRIPDNIDLHRAA